MVATAIDVPPLPCEKQIMFSATRSAGDGFFEIESKLMRSNFRGQTLFFYFDFCAFCFFASKFV
jgi:hypothetical protein